MSSFGRSYFGEATARIARLLGVAGEIPVELGKQITPVLLLGDGTSPGMAGSRNRNWAMTARPVGGAVSTNWGFKATESVVITQLSAFLATAGEISVAYLGPDVADPWTMATSTAIMLDRNVNNERAPVLDGVTAGVAETAGVFYRHFASTTENRALFVRPFFMLPGSKLLFRWAAAVSGTFNVQGQTF